MSIPTAEEATHVNKKLKVAAGDGDTDEEVYDLFGKAVSCGFLDNVKQLVEEGKVDVPSATSILLSTGDNIAMVQYLVEKGAVLDSNVIRGSFGSPNDAAVAIPKLQIFLEAKPELVETVWTFALMYLKAVVVEFLLQNFTIAAASIQGSLFEVAARNHGGSAIVDILKLLIENGASVRANNPRSQTALLIALEAMHNTSDRNNGLEIIKGLMGDLDISEMEGALHIAAQRGNIGAVKLLIERGMDVNATNANGETPLHLVRDENLALFLVHMGADIYKICHRTGGIAMASVCHHGEEGVDTRQTMILAEMSRTMKTGLEKLNTLVG